MRVRLSNLVWAICIVIILILSFNSCQRYRYRRAYVQQQVIAPMGSVAPVGGVGVVPVAQPIVQPVYHEREGSRFWDYMMLNSIMNSGDRGYDRGYDRRPQNTTIVNKTYNNTNVKNTNVKNTKNVKTDKVAPTKVDTKITKVEPKTTAKKTAKPIAPVKTVHKAKPYVPPSKSTYKSKPTYKSRPTRSSRSSYKSSSSRSSYRSSGRRR